MNLSRRVALGLLFCAVAQAEAARMSMKATRSGSPPPPPPAAPLEDVPGPAGSASFTVNFAAVNNTDGIVLYYDTTANTSTDPADWPYRKVSVGAGLTSVTVPGRAAGTYYGKPAGYTGSTVGDLGQRLQVTAA